MLVLAVLMLVLAAWVFVMMTWCGVCAGWGRYALHRAYRALFYLCINHASKQALNEVR